MTQPTLKTKAVAFLETVASGNVKEAYEKYVAPGFRHHNQYFKGDRESLLAGMQEVAANKPQKTLNVVMSLQEGDRVVTYSHVKQDSGDRGGAVVHIFRFEDGLIAEMWDVGAPIQEHSPNENGMF